jgi:hypothetical protein
MEHVHHLTESGEAQLVPLIAQWHQEVRSLLPNMPESLEVGFNNKYLIPDTGTGGFALSPKKIALAFDPNFSGDKHKQLNDLKGTYFHESYHVVQDFTQESAQNEMPAIDNAIYEGAATRFESIRAHTRPAWAEYPERGTMLRWLEEVKRLPLDYNWRRYKFYDSESGRRWIMYRLGTFIVDEALANNASLRIEDLSSKSPSEILRLSGLDRTA